MSWKDKLGTTRTCFCSSEPEDRRRYILDFVREVRLLPAAAKLSTNFDYPNSLENTLFEELICLNDRTIGLRVYRSLT